MPFGSPSGPGQPIGVRGAVRQSIDGVGRVEIRRVDATDGPAGIASVGVMSSNGPNFNSQPSKFRQNWVISGITKDSTGAVLPGCSLALFQTYGDTVYNYTTSDSVTGSYSFLVPSNGITYYIRAYKSGSPDVAGTSVNTLIGTLT